MLPRDSNVVSGRVQVGIIATHKLQKNYFSILAMTIEKFSDGNSRKNKSQYEHR